ncbi:hypothetical protein ACFC1B_30285 [Streptomyces xiamenensis]
MLMVNGFAAACFGQIAQVSDLLVTANDVLESPRAEDKPMYSEGRP